jgi:hypothetical protein
VALDEYRKEEALEKLKIDVNELNKSFTPQYKLTIQSLSEASFSELKSFRQPPAKSPSTRSSKTSARVECKY